MPSTAALYDPVSVTGLIAGGANLVCFTTGRGPALGTRSAPTLKLATNDDLYARMPDDVDINCGPVFAADVSVAGKGLEVHHALFGPRLGSTFEKRSAGLWQQ